MKKILPPILFLAFVVLIGLSSLLPGFSAHINFPHTLLGLPLCIAGLALSSAGKKLFVKTDTNINTFQEPDVLVSHGVFKYSRNPMYLGFIIALLGISILFGAAFYSMLIVAIFIVICDRWYIAFEERAMQQQFGNNYIEYCRKVRRWL